ncbi:MAG: antA/AntB antirepressor family protein [Holosporaceae bacterium]|jgi:anti-repressor protein|nr:antA/AntB antirepressor family protein [Holosporaceae bacterium]
MNELIQINYKNEKPTVSGRDLHTFLEVETPYHKWFPRMCEYGFVEGRDFWTFLSESIGGRPATEHSISIPMAKEFCMLQRSAKGKEYGSVNSYLLTAWNNFLHPVE